jgi:hypothetical protein
MNVTHLIFKMAELLTCTEREQYLRAQEQEVMGFLHGQVNHSYQRRAQIKPAVHGLAGAWQTYLTLPGDIAQIKRPGSFTQVPGYVSNKQTNGLRTMMKCTQEWQLLK